MNFNGIEYEECEEVYPPAEDTFLLIDNLIIDKSDSVLEAKLMETKVANQ